MGDVGEDDLRGDATVVEGSDIHVLEENLDLAALVINVVDDKGVVSGAKDLDLTVDLAMDGVLLVVVDVLEGVYPGSEAVADHLNGGHCCRHGECVPRW